MDPLLLPLILHILNITDQQILVGLPKSEEEREILTLKCHYFTLIHTLVHNKLDPILLSERNGPHLSQILQTVIKGCNLFLFPGTQLKCVATFRKLLTVWGTAQAPFNSLLFELTAIALKLPGSPEFNSVDAQANNVLTESCLLIHETTKKFGDVYRQYLFSAVLPAFNWAPEVLQAFMFGLNGTPMDLKNFIRKLYALNLTVQKDAMLTGSQG